MAKASPHSSPSPSKSPAAASTPAKPPPAAWSDSETVYLIQIYQDKWYANNRAALKPPQWDEIASLVAARFGGSDKVPDKTAIQCRHKIEKLRKRFRAERNRSGGRASWPFYDLMDGLDRGPKAPARPLPPPHRASHGSRENYYDDEDENEEDYGYGRGDDNDDEDDEDRLHSRSQSINYILQRPAMVHRFPSDQILPSNSAAPGFAPRHPEPRPKRAREDALSEVAREITAFAEAYVRMENEKMEMFKEVEQSRLDMESKRMEMILDSQRKVVQAIAEALVKPQEAITKIDQAQGS